MAKTKEKTKKKSLIKKEVVAKKEPLIAPTPVPDLETELKRLNRISGQVEGIKRMLEEHRPVNDVLIQFKAVHSAMKSVESRILTMYVNNSVEEIITTDKKKDREEKITALLQLYRQV